MPRRPRVAPGGLVYHVLNRAVGRMVMFRRDADFEAFERIMQEAHELHPIRILSYCLMSNHWHFVVWPERDGQVTDFFRWLTHTHAMRWRVSHHTVGYGHLYQGRFKSFPIARMCIYCVSADMWMQCPEGKTGGAGGTVAMVELMGQEAGNQAAEVDSLPWPVERGRDWIELVNREPGEAELKAIETSEQRGRPLGSAAWTAKTVAELGLVHTVRSEGRPAKIQGGAKRG